MRFPSLRQMSADLGHTVRRFPLVLVLAAAGTAAALVLIDAEGSLGPSLFYKLLVASGPGIPLLTAMTLLAEKRSWRIGRATAAQVAAIALVALHAWSVPADMENAPAVHVLRLLLLGFAAVMLLSVGPYVGGGEQNGFWHFNKSLFLRLLVALLYSHVLFAGLALALAALDNLFGLDVPGKRYSELWVLLAGFFTTLFFLAGVPEDLPALERRTEYPKGLKVFAQYILLPLVLVYLVILYAYVGKILISWEWPLGWVSKLILGFSGTGLFALLLLHPLRAQTEHQWMKNAPRTFAIVLLPMLVVFFLAVSRRVGEYGITEGRFLAYGLGGWLVLLALSFLVWRLRNIKMIPATLGILSLLISVGPWSMFSVSEGSQVARLQQILERNNILRSGAVVKASAPVPFDDAREISALLSYLQEFHGYRSIQPWFSESLKKEDGKSELDVKPPAAVAGMMGVEYVSHWREAAAGFLVFAPDPEALVPINGYSSLVHGQTVTSRGLARSFEGGTLTVRTGGRIDSLAFLYTPAPGQRDSIVLDLKGTVGRLMEKYGGGNTDKIPYGEMRLEQTGRLFDAGIVLWRLRVERLPEGTKTIFYEADLLFRLKGASADSLR